MKLVTYDEGQDPSWRSWDHNHASWPRCASVHEAKSNMEEVRVPAGAAGTTTTLSFSKVRKRTRG